jgi:integrase
VPLRWRCLVALAVYTFARAVEIEALEWKDVTFDTMTLHVHRSVDRVRKRGKIKLTKTGVSRRIPIEAELYPLLRLLHDEAGGRGAASGNARTRAEDALRLAIRLAVEGEDYDRAGALLEIAKQSCPSARR